MSSSPTLAEGHPKALRPLPDADLGAFARDPAAGYRAVRGTTEALCTPLSAEDAVAQSMDDASPAKWHLAHTTWFFETFVLERSLPDYRPFDASFRVLFNSYYNSVGEQHPRPRRGLLTRPSLERVLDYRVRIDEQMTRLLESHPETVAAVVELGLHHEQQHQELILTDLKHLFSCNPLGPAYADLPKRDAAQEVAALRWQRFEAGECSIGHTGPGFAFDNEGPRHRLLLEAFELASRSTTNAEFLAFVEDGGYSRPELWLSDGWARIQQEGWQHPLYWERRDAGWLEHSLGGRRPLRGPEPVTHLSYYEADAFASWAGARLPGEAEWERAAAERSVTGNFLEDGWLHPLPAAPFPATGEGDPLQQLFGDVWEWTRSPYAPYPRYRAPEGALGEYNGKFMCSQQVLRGGSCITPRSHARASYRNFFPPGARWQFSGVRLARDA